MDYWGEIEDGEQRSEDIAVDVRCESCAGAGGDDDVEV